MSVIKSTKTLASRHPSSAKRTARPGGKVSSTGLAIASVAALAAGLAGCRGHTDHYSAVRGTVIADPAARHPIAISKAPVQMDIEVPRGSSGLTPSQSSRLKAFVTRYRREGEGQLIVSAPSGGNNEYAVVNTVSDVRKAIHGTGISNHALSMEPYFVSGHTAAPIKVSFTTLVAKGPECGLWPSNLASSDRNANYHNFGCAQQKNLASLAANPKDLVTPRGFDPRSGERRDVLSDKWIQGDVTGAQKSEEERSGTVSEVAN
ncbi:MAG: CpaD family pilus assembly protein [Pseudomonadota bacterium]